MISKRIALLVLSALLIFQGADFCAAEESKQDLTIQEISKTAAAKYYISRQYPKALQAFEEMEAEYPISPTVKRYVALSYDALGKKTEAIAKLKESLTLKDDDAVARQMLGDLYVKQGDLRLAETEFQWVVTHMPQSAEAKYAEKKLKEVRQGIQLAASEPSGQMGLSAFMKSHEAQQFSAGNFQEAVKGFDQLLEKYPNDVLIHRFRGIALARLNRFDEAIQAYQKGLSIEPGNIATRYYLAEAYRAIKNEEAAKTEFRWVMDHDKGNYKSKAENALFQNLKAPSKKAPAPARKWGLSVTSAYQYDTNATYKSRDDRFSTAGDQNSSVFPLTGIGSYRFYEKGKFSLSADGIYAHNLYSDFPNLKTYTFGGGISGLYRFSMFKRPAFLNIRDGMTNTLLRNRFFVWSHTLSPTLIFFPHPRFRITGAYRFGINQYGGNGSNPDLTSRDAFTHFFSWNNQFYLNKAKNFYLSLGYDFEHAAATGKNYIKNAHGFNTGVHFPILFKIEGDLEFRFKDSDFPKYAFDPPARRDDQFVLTAELSRALTRNLMAIISYTYETTKARNNLYEYYKNLFGVSLTYKF